MPRAPRKPAADWEDISDTISKTEQKKAMERLKQLGEQLAALPPARIEALEIGEELKGNLLELQSIPTHEARRRHVQRIGKLLRHEDETLITAALSVGQPPRRQAQLDRWIMRLMDQTDAALKEFVRQYPAADRHTLRQYVLRIQRAQAQDATQDELAPLQAALHNYVQQVAVLSE